MQHKAGDYFNVQIQNNSTLDDSQVYVTAFGSAFDPTQPTHLAVDQSFISLTAEGYGTLVTPTSSTSSLTYSYPLNGLTKTGGVYNLYLPPSGGRVYLSIGAPLCLSIQTTGNVAINDPNFILPQDPNYQVIYDKIEYFWNPLTSTDSDSPPIPATAVIDTTAVDFFGLPLTVSLNGQTKGIKKSLSDVQNILLNGNSSSNPTQPGLTDSSFTGSWEMLPVYGSNGTAVRVVSPNKAPSFRGSYLHDYITDVWIHYGKPGNTLTIAVQTSEVSGNFTGSNRSVI